jgi:hypothetical protein
VGTMNPHLRVFGSTNLIRPSMLVSSYRTMPGNEKAIE